MLSSQYDEFNEYLEEIDTFQELDLSDRGYLDDDDLQAEDAAEEWLKSNGIAASSLDSENDLQDDCEDEDEELAGGEDCLIHVNFGDSMSFDGDLFVDCLSMFLLSPLDFELDALSSREGVQEALADDRWQQGGQGMVPDDFAECLQRAQWKAGREWGVRFEWAPSLDDYESQAREFFEHLQNAHVCTINCRPGYENPFEGMSPLDFGNYNDDFIDEDDEDNLF